MSKGNIYGFRINASAVYVCDDAAGHGPSGSMADLERMYVWKYHNLSIQKC